MDERCSRVLGEIQNFSRKPAVLLLGRLTRRWGDNISIDVEERQCDVVKW